MVGMGGTNAEEGVKEDAVARGAAEEAVVANGDVLGAAEAEVNGEADAGVVDAGVADAEVGANEKRAPNRGPEASLSEDTGAAPDEEFEAPPNENPEGVNCDGNDIFVLVCAGELCACRSEIGRAHV